MNLADNWTETLSYSNDEEEANSVEQDKASPTDTKIEVSSMSYDDGLNIEIRIRIQHRMIRHANNIDSMTFETNNHSIDSIFQLKLSSQQLVTN